MHANSTQAIDQIRERLRAGEISAAEANVEMVRTERFRLVQGKMGQSVRNALNAAVKAGQLGRLPKEKFKPEAYFHPNFAFMAKAARNEEESKAHAALTIVFATKALPA